MNKKAISLLICGLLTIGLAGCSSESSASSSEAEASASALAAESKSAEAAKAAAASEQAKQELDSAKSELSSTISDAHTLLDSSNDNVADPQTRVDLTDAINTATAIDSDSPDDFTDAVQPLQSAMDKVTASVEQKKADDAAAAQKAAEEKAAQEKAAQEKAAADQAAAQKAAAEAAAQAKAKSDAEAAQQQSQQQSGNGSLLAVCKDGTRSTSAPGAPNYRGMCSHHGGISQKIGRQ
ncbi:hypothetical protein [Bifidobacterium psychraerophilum]|uniref:hypothetical protein n=1 Tax=Bifidobacterium psychraerophilum TaxID=218140 RepID=UPI0039E88F1B